MISKLGYILFHISISLISVLSIQAQEIEWTGVFGGETNDEGQSVCQTEDGGYIIGGSTYSFGAGSYDFYVIKTDPSGNLEWESTYGTSNREYAHSLRQTSDLGFIIAGTTQPIPGHRDIYLVKIDSLGTMQWDAVLGYGGNVHDDCYSVQQTSDDGYILVGNTDSTLVGVGTDIYLVKTDSIGNLEWDIRFGGASSDWARSIDQTIDGGYFIAGGTYSYEAGRYDYYVIKTDCDGNLDWDATFGGEESDRCQDGIQTSDGGFVVTGYSNSFSSSCDDVYVVKIDSLGMLEWEVVIGAEFDDQAYCIRQTIDEGYILAGNTVRSPTGHPEGYIIKLDQTGNVEWEIICGGDGNEYLHSVQQTSDGGYISTGKTGSYGPGQYSVWLVKIQHEVGITEYNADILTSEGFLLSASPNPFENITLISYSIIQASHVDIAIFDVNGRKVIDLANESHAEGEYSLAWTGTNNQGESVPAGVYFVRMVSCNQHEVKKIVFMQ